jgi:hypothetical protein
MALSEEQSMADNYLIWSNEHNAWWCAARSGYTDMASRAGRFTRDEAFKIAFQRDRTPDAPLPEIPIREDDALDLMKIPATI